MRGNRMERFVLLPFGVGCMSESSVGVASSSPQSHRPSLLHPPDPTIITNDDDDDECSSKSSSSWSLPKPIGIDRLFKTFFSHLFVYKEEEEEDEIEIGVPTDVKHVTHIGWDGVVVNIGGGHNNNNINHSESEEDNSSTLHLQLHDHFFLNNNNNESSRLQLRLSNHQLPHPNNSDGQDHTQISTPINNPDHLII